MGPTTNRRAMHQTHTRLLLATGTSQDLKEGDKVIGFGKHRGDRVIPTQPATCYLAQTLSASIGLHRGSLWIAAEQDVLHVALYLYSILYYLGRVQVVLLT